MSQSVLSLKNVTIYQEKSILTEVKEVKHGEFYTSWKNRLWMSNETLCLDLPEEGTL
jgi:hypothetical protein